MFEDQTYEVVLERLLSKAPPGIDTRPGAIYYDACSPAAAEISQLYIFLDSILELAFASTSNGKWLAMRTSEFGVDPYEANSAIRRAHFNVEVPVNSRFYIDGVYFITMETGKDVQVRCETPGIIGNKPIEGSSLIPDQTIPNLQSALLGELLIPGREKEDDDSLKARHQKKVRKPAKSGNTSHYEEWAKEVEGVGEVKVFPLWNGRGTVKVVITGPDLTEAPETLVRKVQEYIDPEPGMGKGKAPVGATVTVVSATIKTIDISITLKLSNGSDTSGVQVIVTPPFEKYLKSIAFKSTTVQRNRFGAILLSQNEIIDYSKITLNGAESDVELSEIDIPILGTVEINEQI